MIADVKGQLALVVSNAGRHPHNLTLPDGRGVAVDASQTAIILASLDDLPLKFVCTIHPGMDGEIRRSTSQPAGQAPVVSDRDHRASG